MSPNCSQTKTTAKVIIPALISKKNKKKKVNALTFLHSRPVSAHRGPIYQVHNRTLIKIKDLSR